MQQSMGVGIGTYYTATFAFNLMMYSVVVAFMWVVGLVMRYSNTLLFSYHILSLLLVSYPIMSLVFSYLTIFSLSAMLSLLLPILSLLLVSYHLLSLSSHLILPSPLSRILFLSYSLLLLSLDSVSSPKPTLVSWRCSSLAGASLSLPSESSSLPSSPADEWRLSSVTCSLYSVSSINKASKHYGSTRYIYISSLETNVTSSTQLTLQHLQQFHSFFTFKHTWMELMNV